MMNKHNTFNIGDTARMAGVSQKQIRHWESRGYIPPAMRIVCGERAYRYFSKSQMEQIKAVKAMLDRGFTLAHAAKVTKESEHIKSAA
jgi:DNA-binding transcriptional MerR regulator